MSDQDEKDQVRNPETVQKETVVVKEDAEKHPVSSMAIISLVLGVISLLASVFKELDLVALCLGALGVLCALIGFFTARSTGRHRGKSLVIVGLILSLLAIVVAFFMHGGINQPFVVPGIKL